MGTIRPGAWPLVGAIARRDLIVVVRSRAVMLPILIVPIILFVGLPVGVVAALRLGGDQLAELEALLEALPPGVRQQLGDGSIEAQLIAYLIEFQFASLFLIVPLMVAAVIAADSFAGEKERKTLEALLYTPTTDFELYVAKLVAPWTAATTVALAGFVLYAVSVNVAAAGEVGRLLAITPLWLVVILWVTPAVAALGLGVLVLVSARVRGFQEAYQLGGLIVLPIVLLIVAQLTGLLFLDAVVAVVLGALVWIAAVAVLWLGFRSFRRERLLLSA